ncbi:hypothetical protein LX32DRAFT_637340 [Colletotrichum zoysiae]|uniref:Uncharacterized protein n=1 Tax=Colletotrichum zoysiae TaxID=1216348 RepID=A0AAD9HM01_9PEZI|nr:hypothetical protein LX32DRAFT_637340 [Colletotrichum zoysiae]
MNPPPAKKSCIPQLHEPEFNVSDYCIQCVWKIARIKPSPGVSGKHELVECKGERIVRSGTKCVACAKASATCLKITVSVYYDCKNLLKAYLRWWHYVSQDSNTEDEVNRAKKALETSQKQFQRKCESIQFMNETYHSMAQSLLSSVGGIAQLPESSNSLSGNQS